MLGRWRKALALVALVAGAALPSCAADGNILWQLRLKGPIYATPVLDTNRLYVRTEKALYCFEGP